MPIVKPYTYQWSKYINFDAAKTATKVLENHINQQDQVYITKTNDPKKKKKLHPNYSPSL